jgi:hypothetical protein
MSASGQFNVGKDVSLDIIGPSGPLRFSIITSFDSKPSYKSVDSKGMDGVDRYDDLPAGWSGTISLDRADSTVDDFFAKKEADFYSGISSTLVTITETISEIGGSVSQYRYTGVALTLQDAGKKSADNKISIVIGFRAARRMKIA